MKTFVRFGAFLVCAVLAAGCGGDGGGSNNGNTGQSTLGTHPAESDLIRVGDKITVQLSGVPDGGFFLEKQIPPTGDISLSYLTQSFHAVDKTTAALASEIVAAYKSQRIYTNPVVVVLEEERYINVGGDVRGPTNIVYRADSTLMSTINSCGGFTEFADRRHVRILRGSQAFYYDCVKAATNPGSDPPVYPGDQIYVPRTPF